LLEGIGETLVAAAGGRVTPDAVALFEQAARADSSRFGARYYLALAKAQGGDIPTAMTLWRAMQADVPANSPWREQLAATLQAAQQQAGGAPPDVAAAGSPSDTGASAGAAQQAAILGMAPEQRMEAISGMVDGLAERLANQPNDLNGWKRLGRAYMVLGKADKSAAAYAHAATLTPNDPELLAAEADAIRAASIKDKNIDPADAAVPDAAQALYVKALALDPNQPQGLWFVGLAASHAHRLDEARQDWTRLLGLLDPNSTDYLDVKRALDALAKS
jgi:cytochrome c-type biogenesis protein CcmH